MEHDIYIQEFEREVFRELYGAGDRRDVVSFVDPISMDGRIVRIVSRVARGGTAKWLVMPDTEKNDTGDSSGFQFQRVGIDALMESADLVVMSQAFLDYAVQSSAISRIIGAVGDRGVILVAGIPSQAEASSDLLIFPGSVCYCSTPVSGRGDYLTVVYRASSSITTNSWDR